MREDACIPILSKYDIIRTRLWGGGGHSGLNEYPLPNGQLLEAKKRSGKLQTKNLIGAAAYKLCLYSLYSIKYDILCIESCVGRWNIALKNRGRLKRD